MMNINYTIIPGNEVNTTGQDLDFLIEEESEEEIKQEEQFDFTKTYYQVCDIYKQDPDKVIKHNSSRKREYVLVRQLTMTLAKLRSKMSLNEIGAPFKKDHATVLHAVKTIKNLKDTNSEFKKDAGHLFKDTDKWPYIK